MFDAINRRRETPACVVLLTNSRRRFCKGGCVSVQNREHAILQVIISSDFHNPITRSDSFAKLRLKIPITVLSTWNERSE